MVNDSNLLVLGVSVSLAGGLGAVARFFAARWVGKMPWGILLANSLASAILGWFIGAEPFVILVVSAFAGGFSTFSSFAAQTHTFLTTGSQLKGYLNIALNFLGPSTGVILGAAAAAALLN